MPRRSIIGFHQSIILDDLTDKVETAIAVILLGDNNGGKGTRDGGAMARLVIILV